MHHRVVVAGITHNKSAAHERLIAESIELKASPAQHRVVDYEDSVRTTTSTLSPSERDTTETNLSVETARSFEKDESCYKRSSSYHGKSSKGLFKVVVSRCCNKNCHWLFLSIFVVLAMLYKNTFANVHFYISVDLHYMTKRLMRIIITFPIKVFLLLFLNAC